MHAPAKYAEKGLSWLANGLWYAIQPLYRIAPNPSITPKWSDRPLLKSKEKFRPPLGVLGTRPRSARHAPGRARQAILDSKATPDLFTKHHAGEIPAQIIERDAKIWMVKDCPKHGHYEDVLSTDPAFFKKIEQLDMERPARARGRRPARSRRERAQVRARHGADGRSHEPLQHDVRPVLHRRQPGRVRARTRVDEIKAILDRAAAKKPHRQMSVQFSGGEPTLSKHFLKAVAYCMEVGFKSVQAATNGIEFAKDPEFCHKAREAGLRFVYLQFDGIATPPTSTAGCRTCST